MKKQIATLFIGSVLAIGAQASSVSFNFTNPLETTELNQTGNLGLFDSTLGTLTGVSLSFIGSNSTLISLTNNAAQSQRVRATSTTDLNFGSSLAALQTLIAAANPVASLSATTGLQTVNSGATVSFGPFTGSQTVTWTSELDAILGSFAQAGGGLFALSCTSESGLAIQGGGGNVSSKQETQANCGGAITYTYDPATTKVPEPESLLLVGIALTALSLIRRRAAKA